MDGKDRGLADEEGADQDRVDDGAAEDAEHGVAPPQVQADGDGQGQDAGQRPGRVGQRQVAQRIGDEITMTPSGIRAPR